MSEDEPMVTLTESEVAALVDSRIAARDAKAQREAEQRRQLLNPTYPPAPSSNAPDEVVAEFGAALDASGNDVDKATNSILVRLSLDIHNRPTDPNFRALFYSWPFANDVMHPGSLILTVMANIQRQRERAKASVK